MASSNTLTWKEIDGNLSMVSPDGIVLYTIPKENSPVSVELTAQLVKDLGVDSVNLIFDTRAMEINKAFDAKIGQATSAYMIAQLEVERTALQTIYSRDRMLQWQQLAEHETGFMREVYRESAARAENTWIDSMRQEASAAEAARRSGLSVGEIERTKINADKLSQRLGFFSHVFNAGLIAEAYMNGGQDAALQVSGQIANSYNEEMVLGPVNTI